MKRSIYEAVLFYVHATRCVGNMYPLLNMMCEIARAHVVKGVIHMERPRTIGFDKRFLHSIQSVFVS